MGKGGQRMHTGMDKETYDRHYAANKTIGGHHGIEGSPNKQLVQPAQNAMMAGNANVTMSNMPPQPSNVMGAAQPVFNQPAVAAANNIYGNVQARQNAAGAPPIFKKYCKK
tara:strand:+ start:538 stop:870 length:333 start_codon:yes stop_codon:yes gene_type:complete